LTSSSPPHQVFHCIQSTILLSATFTGVMLIVHESFVCGGLVLIIVPIMVFQYYK